MAGLWPLWKSAAFAEEIEDPCSRVLAGCELISAERFDDVLQDVRRCAPEEQPLLFEALTVACGMKGLSSAALKASDGVPSLWPRVRALCEAARCLVDIDEPDKAASLLDRAEDLAPDIPDVGSGVHAHIQLAVRYARLGSGEAVDDHLRMADSDLAKLDDRTTVVATLPQLVEAAVVAGRPQFARRIIAKTLQPDVEDELRDRLVPMLVLAGDYDRAVSECIRKPLTDDFARRVVAYRLAMAGEVTRAIEYAKDLKPAERQEALSDIAIAQIRRDPATPGRGNVVGVSLFGSWGRWIPRLERLGLPWELIPLSAPYELGGEGLRAAAMSSLSSGVNSSCSVITTDFIDRFRRRTAGTAETDHVRLAKFVSVAVGVVVVALSTGVGAVQGNLLEVAFKVVNLLTAPLFGLFFMAMFVRWATGLGTIVGAVFGLVVVATINYWPDVTDTQGISFLWAMPLSFLTQISVGMLASLLPVGNRAR